MDVKQLQLFVETVKLGSFAAVARGEGVDPSSVSRQIASLEERLGVRLFQRTTRSLSLTEEGEAYWRRVEPLLEELARAEDAVQMKDGQPRGRLRLSSSVAFGQTKIVPLLGAFKARYPELQVELHMTDANVDLIAERMDLAVRLSAHLEGDLIATRLMMTRYRVCASPDYLQRAGKPSLPADLAGHDCLLFTLAAFRNTWKFQTSGGRLEEVAIDGHFSFSSALALKSAALQGMGPALLADWMTDEDVREGRLIDLFPRHQVTATNFETAAWLIYPSRSFLPLKTRVMIDFLKAELG